MTAAITSDKSLDNRHLDWEHREFPRPNRGDPAISETRRSGLDDVSSGRLEGGLADVAIPVLRKSKT